jgi:hypothetical protein
MRDQGDNHGRRRATLSGKPNASAEVHPELEGFDVRLNAYGQVEMTKSIEELNAFLERASGRNQTSVAQRDKASEQE